MPLPTPVLDDRRFQDIVDEAKRLIPQYCPEWTDHNVSDPGITLVELFAWMTDLLLYRVNQVPDKMYIKFLDMIGVRLEPPRAARAPVTFYLSAAQPADVTIPEGTEVATVRTETNPAIVFTTDADLTVRTASLQAALTRGSDAAAEAAWINHDLRQLELPGQRISMFPNPPTVGGAFYLGFERDHSHHVMAIILECETAGGAGIDPNNPPTEWQVWQGGLTRWATCEVEYDGTGGFNQSGEIILHLPAMTEGEFQGVRGFWLRCRLTEAQSGSGGYRVSPEIERLAVEARGGTVGARHATTVTNEPLGISDGTPGQSFRLLRSPLLSRDPERDVLLVERPDGVVEEWHEVADFADSHADDRVFTLDGLDGTLQLGPALLQPDGGVYRFGAVPPKGARLTMKRYQHGGGVAGNLPRGMLTTLKTSIPYVAHVANRQPAVGGRDAQTLEDAKLRAPQTLRTRTRAVTADDYEYLAREVPGVARARCVAPGVQPGDPNAPKPGQVLVVAVPTVDDPTGQIPGEQLTLSAELRSAVLAQLEARRLVGTTVDVRGPQYFWVSVQGTLHVPPRSDPALLDQVRAEAERELYRYLNPFTGGPNGDGWPFGRDLHVSEIYGVLQRIRYVEFVEDVQLTVLETIGSGAGRPVDRRLSIPDQALICSGQHQITVR